LIHETERRLAKLETANPVDKDKVQATKKRLADLHDGRNFIRREVVNQQIAFKASKSVSWYPLLLVRLDSINIQSKSPVMRALQTRLIPLPFLALFRVFLCLS